MNASESLQSGQWDYVDQTILHPYALVALLVLGVMLLVLPRRYAAIPIIALTCFISARQRVSLAGADFTLLRLMVVIGWARVFLYRETKGFRWNSLDKVVIGYAIAGTLIHTFRVGTASVFVYRLGHSFDAIGMYFLFRMFFRNWRDIEAAVTGIVVISVPVAITFLIEGTTGRNWFSIFGGVREFTAIREGRMRCQGAFPHPILAGCYWVSFLPLMAATWWRGTKKDRTLALTGVFCGTLIIVMCSSSTPVFGWLLLWVGGLLYFARQYLAWIRWGFVAMLVTLHFVMEAPVWHLLARVSAVGGSTGWHRYLLIDEAIMRFGEWWLLGIDDLSAWRGRVFDVTNHFLVEGFRGGSFTLLLFCVSIGLAFAIVGRKSRAFQREPRKFALVWAMGVSLLAQTTMFIGVSYFGQVIIAWYLMMGMIGSVSGFGAAPGARRRRREPPPPRRSRGAQHPLLGSHPR